MTLLIIDYHCMECPQLLYQVGMLTDIYSVPIYTLRPDLKEHITRYSSFVQTISIDVDN